MLLGAAEGITRSSYFFAELINLPLIFFGILIVAIGTTLPELTFGIKSVLMGFGLESDAIHSPNENYRLENFWNGIRSIVKFYHYFSGKE